MSQEEIHVVGAAIIRDAEVLIALRSDEMSAPGRWEFPGGKVEAGESPRESLKREIDEELGIDVRVLDYLGTGRADVEGAVIRLDVYHCEIDSGTPRPREHAELRWVGEEALGSLDWAEADVPVLEAVRERLTRS